MMYYIKFVVHLYVLCSVYRKLGWVNVWRCNGIVFLELMKNRLNTDVFIIGIRCEVPEGACTVIYKIVGSVL
jgi:hypothetical protein